jgi:hypothetical protein
MAARVIPAASAMRTASAPGTCVDGRGSGRAAHPRQQWTHEPNCTGQRGQWISGQTDEDGIFEAPKGKRFPGLHRDLMYGKFRAEVAQGIPDVILFADRDSCRGQNEIRVDGRMPERRPHRGHVALDDGHRADDRAAGMHQCGQHRKV